eukprot:comp20787_c0_seq1/m.27309 comp20787_c0_seq1/g.27309  ORF comp20787_c0_seq1/g.27309 comp20787_c0_seq1/m.27309 type:complete len:420 (-) comp20787_c0_seq1:390-1649(-)
MATRPNFTRLLATALNVRTISFSSCRSRALVDFRPALSRKRCFHASTAVFSELKFEITPAVERRLQSLLNRHKELQGQMTERAAVLSSEEYERLSKEMGSLTAIAQAYQEHAAIKKELQETRSLLEESQNDEEMRKMAEMELEGQSDALAEAEQRLLTAIIPRDDADEKSALLEIRAGAGGSEAALFVQDLLTMYQNYSKTRRWRFDLISEAKSEMGGYKEVVAEVSGHGVFGRFKHEAGTHRVQRVPDTETQGRVHTSTATVAIMPQATEVDIDVQDKDLRIDTYRSGGAGGQHVNTTDSAVRITHIPTGLVVAVQDERSQHKNKAKALLLLRSRLYEQQRMKLQLERAAQRKSQTGRGERHERIRTYNYPQGRVTDHRLNKTHYGLGEVIGGEALDEFVDELIAQHELMVLADSLSE